MGPAFTVFSGRTSWLSSQALPRPARGAGVGAKLRIESGRRARPVRAQTRFLDQRYGWNGITSTRSPA